MPPRRGLRGGGTTGKTDVTLDEEYGIPAAQMEERQGDEEYRDEDETTGGDVLPLRGGAPQGRQP